MKWFWGIWIVALGMWHCVPEAPLRNVPMTTSPKLVGLRLVPDTNLYLFAVEEQKLISDDVLDSLHIAPCAVRSLASIGPWIFLQCGNQGYFLDPALRRVVSEIPLPDTPFIPVILDLATAVLLSPQSTSAFVVDFSTAVAAAPMVTDTLSLPALPVRWEFAEGALFFVGSDARFYKLRFPPLRLASVATLDTLPLFLRKHPLTGKLWFALPEKDGRLRWGTFDPADETIRWHATVALQLGKVRAAQINPQDFLYLFTQDELSRIDLRSLQQKAVLYKGEIPDVLLLEDGSFSCVLEGGWQYWKFDNHGQRLSSIPLPFATRFFVEK